MTDIYVLRLPNGKFFLRPRENDLIQNFRVVDYDYATRFPCIESAGAMRDILKNHCSDLLGQSFILSVSEILSAEKERIRLQSLERHLYLQKRIEKKQTVEKPKKLLKKQIVPPKKDAKTRSQDPYFQAMARAKGGDFYALRRRQEGLTLEAIGALMGVTRERVRQRVIKAEKRLQKYKDYQPHKPNADVYAEFVDQWKHAFEESYE
jgi:hypothetical protein